MAITPTPIVHYGRTGRYIYFDDEPLSWANRVGRYIELDDEFEQVDRVGIYIRIEEGF